MSETTETTGSEAAPEATDTTGVAEAAIAAATEAANEAAAEGGEGKKPDAPGEPKWFRPAIDRLTREKHEARREVDQLRAELELLKAARGGNSETEQKPAAGFSEADIQRRAEEIVARQRSAERTRSLISEGVKEFGQEDWNAKTGIIAALGATDNPAFMRALAAIPAGHKVAVALADEPDRLASLLSLEPLEMAAEMGRMAVEVGAPKAKTISNAPKPITPVTGRGAAAPDINDPNLSMKEWVALRNKTAPVRLGGQRRPT